MNVQKDGAAYSQKSRPEGDPGATIITIGIGCCGLALALVLAVAYLGV